MRIGIAAAREGRLAAAVYVRAAAAAAEQVGYASIWAPDNSVDPATGLDPLGVLADMAAVTHRIRLGTSVLVARYRPLALARSLVTLDVFSDGRLIVAFDDDPAPDDTVLDELIGALDAGTGGRRARALVLLATQTPAVLERVARHADGWHAAGVPVEHLAASWSSIRAGADRLGRDPEQLQLVVRADVRLTNRPVAGERRAFTGNSEQLADDIEEVRAAGAHEVVLAAGSGDSLDEMLDAYARIAEAVALRPTRR
jgi:alkanesulfonate monooxygenase SsuD/methylene tetrahydromethanopterin reductase-like flavin-dependent oxidoreductase (luciferase family)